MAFNNHSPTPSSPSTPWVATDNCNGLATGLAPCLGLWPVASSRHNETTPDCLKPHDTSRPAQYPESKYDNWATKDDATTKEQWNHPKCRTTSINFRCSPSHPIKVNTPFPSIPLPLRRPLLYARLLRPKEHPVSAVTRRLYPHFPGNCNQPTLPVKQPLPSRPSQHDNNPTTHDAITISTTTISPRMMQYTILPRQEHLIS